MLFASALMSTSGSKPECLLRARMSPSANADIVRDKDQPGRLAQSISTRTGAAGSKEP
jgi:hypothetical protein